MAQSAITNFPQLYAKNAVSICVCHSIPLLSVIDVISHQETITAANLIPTKTVSDGINFNEPSV